MGLTDAESADPAVADAVSEALLNPPKAPAEIDYKRATPNGIIGISGICRLEGDPLTLYNSRHGHDRPGVFTSSTSDVGCSLIELHRVTVPDRFGAPRDEPVEGTSYN